MKRITVLLATMPILIALSTCSKSDDTHTLGCPYVSCGNIYTAIRSNQAPELLKMNDVSRVFIASTVTTRSQYTDLSYFCDPPQIFATYPNIHPNPNGRQTTSYLTAKCKYSDFFPDDNVSVNGTTLHYYGCPLNCFKMSPLTGIGLGDSTIWTIYHNSAVPFTLIDHSVVKAPVIVSDTIVNTSNGYTLTGAGPVIGDSVIFLLGDSSHTITKVLPPGTSSCTFTSAELSNFKATSITNHGLAQIATYRKTVGTINGMTASFYREDCFSQYMTIK